MPDIEDITSDEQEGDDQNPPRYKAPYSQIFLFEETRHNLLFNKMKYKVSISVSLMDNKMHPVNSTFDTAAGPKLVREGLLEAEWLKAVQANNRPPLRNVINQKISVVETIHLLVRMGDSRVRVRLGVVRNLAVPVLLETSFIDMFVKGIFSPERRVVPYNSKEVLVLVINDLPQEHNNNYNNAQDMMNSKEEHAPCLVRVAR